MAHHLTLQERETIARLIKRRWSRMEIAEVLERDRSTIYRELKRNTGWCGYRPRQAQQKAEERRKRCRRPVKMSDPMVNAYVREKLKLQWSPEQIGGASKRRFARRPRRQISRQTIYTWIARQGTDEARWRACLRRGGRPVENRGKHRGCVSIRGRPRIVNQRRRYGDWEGDTVVGVRHRGAVLTAVERKSGYLCMVKLDNLRADTVEGAIWSRFRKLPPSLRRTMTFDNGPEFTCHARLTRRLKMAIYFAKPYSAWQRGTNENTNGLIRQYFPKGTDLRMISDYDVARVEQRLNERPRRRLGYRSPAEVLAKRLCCI